MLNVECENGCWQKIFEIEFLDVFEKFFQKMSSMPMYAHVWKKFSRMFKFTFLKIFSRTSLRRKSVDDIHSKSFGNIGFNIQHPTSNIPNNNSYSVAL